MKTRTIILFLIFNAAAVALAQEPSELNKTDQMGRKQGHWIRKYPDGSVMYDGNFVDTHPVGLFTRYYDNNVKMSVLVYSQDGREADATTYHTNGYIASAGKYINQEKTGKWKFYSYYTEGYLINEEEYTGNLRNGASIKYYPDGTVAEKQNYVNGIRDGEWLQYHQDGKIFIRSTYSNGKLNGKFETWSDSGKLLISGFYKENLREGKWLFYDNDGHIRFQPEYVAGITMDKQAGIESTNLIDSLEKNSWKVEDPEKTGEIK